MNGKNKALKAAGSVFLVVALMHLLRIFFKARVYIAGYRIGFSLSIIAFFGALLLSYWMFSESKK